MPSAKYNITDDKIRFSIERRLTEIEYKQARTCGFVFWHGSKLFVAKWSTQAEDFVKSFGVEIVDDDTPDDVESRVERFQNYAETAEDSAQRSADYSDEATTTRRRELAANRAQNETEKAEYWNRRIAGAISHALYRERPDVIYRRIKEIEKNLRSQEKIVKENSQFDSLWNDPSKELTLDRAKAIANYDHVSVLVNGQYRSLWGELADGKLTPEQAREIANKQHAENIANCERWLDHIKMILQYQNELYKASGGIAADKAEVKIEKGGAVLVRGKWCEVEKVNKVTVSVLGLYDWMKHGAKIGIDEVKEIKSAQEWKEHNQ